MKTNKYSKTEIVLLIIFGTVLVWMLSELAVGIIYDVPPYGQSVLINNNN